MIVTIGAIEMFSKTGTWILKIQIAAIGILHINSAARVAESAIKGKNRCLRASVI